MLGTSLGELFQMDGMFIAEVLPLGGVGWIMSAQRCYLWHWVSCGELTNRPVARLQRLKIHTHVGDAFTVGERNVSVDVVGRLLICVWTVIVIMISAIRVFEERVIEGTY